MQQFIVLFVLQNSINPVEDLCQTPPGILALDNMVYFAKMHGENYTKVNIEYDSIVRLLFGL